MSAKEYLESKTKFEDKYPNIPEFMINKEIIKEKKRYKYKRQLPSPRFNKNIYIPFSELEKTNKKISEGTESILNSVKTIAGIVTIAGVSFLGINKILEGMGKLAEGQTAVDLLKPSTYGKEGFSSSGRSTGKVSDKGLQLIKNQEGFHNGTSYQDEAGIWTIGYGHTGQFKGHAIGPGMTITREEAETLIRQDVAKYEKTVNKSVKVPISQNQFDALVSLCYNIGPGAFAQSTVVRKLNAGDYKGAQEAFMMWNKVQIKDKKTGKNVKVESKGLSNRRRQEASLFGSDISSDNKLIGEIINKELPKQTKSTGGISDKYGGSYNIKSGAKIGNYTMKDSRGHDLIMSGQMEQFLNEVSNNYGGYGDITSVMDGNHAGDKNNAGSHYSGNKADIGLRGLSEANIIKQCVPIMRHPAIVHVAFEGLGSNDKESKIISKRIEQKIRQQYSDINNRLNKKEFVIYHWGWKYAHSPHLDIRINPNKLKSQPKQKVNQGSSSDNKIKENNDKIKQIQSNQNNDVKRKSNKTNPTSVNITSSDKKPITSNTKDLGSIDYNDVRASRNGSNKKE